MKLTKGIHHIAIKAKGIEKYNETVNFYTNILGMETVRSWGAGDNLGTMVDTGNSVMEIFSNAPDVFGEGALRHIAFDVEDTDACINAVKNAGYTVTVEPTDIVIQADKPLGARIAFCIGPVGETIEFFQVK
ncbi:MAG: VOC family protein [Clostridia bacterium]|nr:VOC family protein [Clostridia bacterium]